MAVEYGYSRSNPARGKRRKLKATRPQRAYLDSAGQIIALLDAAAELDAEARRRSAHVGRRPLLATLIFAGLRISELLALRWRDVDLAGGWITVGESKTDAGVRKVKIRPVLRDELVTHKASSDRQHPTAFVFGTAAGQAQYPCNVRAGAREGGRAGERAPRRGGRAAAAGAHPARADGAASRPCCTRSAKPPPVVMQELGTPTRRWRCRSTPTRCAATMARTSALRALVEGATWAV